MVDSEGNSNKEDQQFSASDLQKLVKLMNLQLALMHNQMPQAGKTSSNLLQDVSTRFYLQPSENLGIPLTMNPLTILNFHSWSKLVLLSLKSKNKLSFIDGSLPKPDRSDDSFQAWDRYNTLVLSWLHASISSEILHSVLSCHVVCDLWEDLRHRFYQGDLFRIVELEEEMFAIKQGDSFITSHFTRLKTLWEELDEFQPIIKCECDDSCSCGIELMKKYRSQTHIVQLLRGLNDDYSMARSQIMLIKTLPDVNEVYSLLLQQERQLTRSSQNDGKLLINATMNFNNSSNNRFGGSRQDDSRGRGKGSSNWEKGTNRRGQLRKCSHCERTGYLVDTCYRKHGFPPHYKHGFGLKTINNVNTDEYLQKISESLIWKIDKMSLRMIGIAELTAGLYILDSVHMHTLHPRSQQSQLVNKKGCVNNVVNKSDLAALWHSRLGHIAKNRIKAIAKVLCESDSPSGALSSFSKYLISFISYKHISPSHKSLSFAIDNLIESQSFEQVIHHDGCWRQELRDEILALETNKTWVITTLPKGKCAVGCKWVFKTKLKPDGLVKRHKARLVAKGYTQLAGFD
ncbi:uncharacterized protein LOC107484915 [Arachis duranensis]|uniref:Uncharacterized protein LOC107484915 n=1 Tax=Arachis duranensis TaxID=130453 RepID=A0A6P4D8C4_ARADU|nr:uncharacterized protein LOC107484915 [Arachis duranensis]